MSTMTIDVPKATSLNGKSVEGGVHIVPEAEGKALVEAGKATEIKGPEVTANGVSAVVAANKTNDPLTVQDILRIRAEARKSAKQPVKAPSKPVAPEVKND